MSKEPVRFAILGGSGLYKMEGLSSVKEVRVKTPYGAPSDAVILGTLGGVRCAFLPRHGRGHTVLPSEINARANIWALKSLGVERVLAFGAVGSLREELAPRHFVFPDQTADETKGRPSTFFGGGVVGHVAFHRPFCDALSELAFEEAGRIGLRAHRGGVYCCMEGPAFSSKAESETHRRLGYSVIGMTALPEAKLAREAELCYSTVAMVTDYDCWKEGEEVSNDLVIEHLSANVAAARRLIAALLPKLSSLPRACPCARALDAALFTRPEDVPAAARRRLGPVLARRLGR